MSTSEIEDVVEKPERNSENLSKDQLFAILAHDLKSPLNAVMGLAELLESEYEDISDEDKKKTIQQIKNSSRHVYDLLEKIIVWYKSQSGTLEIFKERFIVEDLVDEVLDSLEVVWEKKNIEIFYDLEEELLLNSDSDILRTILRNLLSNAIKFSDEGSKIIIKAFYSNNAVVFEIIDEGLGIPDNLKPRLFEMNDSKIRQGTWNESGSGLGLIICNDLVKLQGGQLTVKDNLPKGSIFSFNVENI